MLEFGGCYEKKDLHEAARLHAWSRKGLLISCLFATVIVALAVLSGLFDLGPLTLGSAVGLLVVSLCLLVWLIVWLGVDRTYRTNQMLRTPFHGSATPEFVEISSEHGGGRFPWSVFHRQCQSERLVLLYQSANLYHLYPRRIFEREADWSEFRRLAAAHVAARPRDALVRGLAMALVGLSLALLALLLWR